MTTYSGCRKQERCGKNDDLNDFYYFSHLIPKHHQITDDFIKSCSKSRSYFVGIERRCRCLIWASTPKNTCLSSFCLIEVLIDKTHGGNFLSCQFMIDHYFKVLRLSTNFAYNRIPYAMERLYEKFQSENPQRFFSTLSRLYSVRHVSQILKKDMIVQQIIPSKLESYNFPRPSKTEDDMEVATECLNNAKVSGICTEDQERFRDLKANAIMMIEVAQKRLVSPNLVDKVSKVLSQDGKKSHSNLTNQSDEGIGPLIDFQKFTSLSKDKLSFIKEEKSKTISNTSKNSYVIKMGEDGSVVKVPIDNFGNLVPSKISNVTDEELQKLNSLGDLKGLRSFQVEIDQDGKFVKQPVDTEGRALFSTTSGAQRVSRVSSLYTLLEDKEEPANVNIKELLSKVSKLSETGVIDTTSVDKANVVSEIKSNASVESKVKSSIVSEYLESQGNFKVFENENPETIVREISQIENTVKSNENANETRENQSSEFIENEKLTLTESGLRFSKISENKVSNNEGNENIEIVSNIIDDVREKSVKPNETLSNLSEKTKSDNLYNLEKLSTNLPVGESGLTKTHTTSKENLELVTQISKHSSLNTNIEDNQRKEPVEIPSEEVFVQCISEDEKITTSMSDAELQNESVVIKNLPEEDEIDLQVERVTSNSQPEKFSENTVKEIVQKISQAASVDLVSQDIANDFDMAETKPSMKSERTFPNEPKNVQIKQTLSNIEPEKLSEISQKEQKILSTPSLEIITDEGAKDFDLADTKPALRSQSSVVEESNRSKVAQIVSNSQEEQPRQMSKNEISQNVSSTPWMDIISNESSRDLEIANLQPMRSITPEFEEKFIPNTKNLSFEAPEKVSQESGKRSITPEFEEKFIPNTKNLSFEAPEKVSQESGKRSITPEFEEKLIPITQNLSLEMPEKVYQESVSKNSLPINQFQESKRSSANIPLPSIKSKVSQSPTENNPLEVRQSRISEKSKLSEKSRISEKSKTPSMLSDKNYAGSILDKRITESLIKCADDGSVASDVEVSSKHSPLRKLLSREKNQTLSHLSSSGSKLSPNNLQRQPMKDGLKNKSFSKASNASIYGEKKPQLSSNSSASKVNDYFFSRRSEVISYTDMNEPGKVKQTGSQYLTDIMNENYISTAERSTESWIIFDTRPRELQFPISKRDSQKNDSLKQFDFQNFHSMDESMNRNTSHARSYKFPKSLEYLDETNPYGGTNKVEDNNRSCSNKFYHTRLTFDFNQIEKEKKIKFDFYQGSDSDQVKSDQFKSKKKYDKNSESLVEVTMDDNFKKSVIEAIKSTQSVKSENCSPRKESSEGLYATETGKESKNKSVQSHIVGEDVYLLSMENTTESLLSESVNYTEVIEIKKSTDEITSKTTSSFQQINLAPKNSMQIIVDIDIINFDSSSTILQETAESVLNDEIPGRNDSSLSEFKFVVTISDPSPIKSTELYTKLSLTEVEQPEMTEKYESNSAKKTSSVIDTNATSSNPYVYSKKYTNKNITNSEISGSTLFSCTTTTRSSETKYMKNLMDPINKQELQLNCQLLGLDVLQATDITKTIDSNYEMEHKTFIPHTYQSHSHRPMTNEEWEARFEYVLKEILIKDENNLTN